MSARELVIAAGVICLYGLYTGSAAAGPPELFAGVSAGAANADTLALRYYYGGSGVFVSGNGGMDFGLVCNSEIDATLVREQDVVASLVTGAGSILMGGPAGLWAGTQDGCGWTAAPELMGKWVSDLAIDPVDPTHSYLVTSTAGEANGLYQNDGKSAAWTALGATAMQQLGTLRIGKTATGKLFYERGVTSAGGMNQFVIRVSEDQGTTWAEYDFGHAEAQDVRIAAIDPSDPARIVVVSVLDIDKTVLPNPPDELWYSASRGMPGSFMKIASVGVLGGATFGPGGVLYYGDNAQDSPGLFVVSSPGAIPKPMSTDYPVSCLTYDPAKQRLYVCSNYEFGVADVASGALQSLFDKRKLSHFVDCPGQPSGAMRCREQMVANYCGYGHYWQAPACATYMVPGSPFDPAKTGAAAAAGGGGSVGSVAAGAPAVAGASGAGSALAGASAAAGAAAPPAMASAKSGGCEMLPAPNATRARASWFVSLFLIGLAWRRRCQK